MEFSSSWEAISFAATEELSNILSNSRVHYGVHKSLLLVPILGHTNLVHTTPFYISKTLLNIYHPPTSSLS
jgi:hypothetical protein